MNKQQDFLMVVQTAILITAAHSDRKNAFGIKTLHFVMSDAVRAAKRIPANMDAIEASDDFLNFMLYKDMGDANDAKAMVCPNWFANLD